MKTPKVLVLGSLILMSVLYACKKNDSAPVPGKTNSKWSGETMTVKLKLSGDLQTTESPLGRQLSNARINPDSVIYAVDIRVYGWLFAQGIFTSLDSLNLKLPKGTDYTIKVAAIKKGSGLGLYETIDSVSSGRFLPGQPLSRYITNRLSTDSVGPEALRYEFIDSLSYFRVAAPHNYYYDEYRYSELDTYYGTYQGNPQDSQRTSITIPLKRMTYGIRFKPENFSDGVLMAEYNYQASYKLVTVNKMKDSIYTYTADDFKYSDNLMNDLPIRLSWFRGNGTYQYLGEITVHPKRNTVTTISITAPGLNSSVPLGISIAENTWRSDTTVVVK